jgi:hypothetical protein
MINSSIPSNPPAVEPLDTDANLFLGWVGGGIAMLVGAAVWGAITYFTEYQIGWMAIGVGFLVGMAIRFFGKGSSIAFGVSGAVLALLGCLLGNFLFYTGVIAREESGAFFDVFLFFLFSPSALVELFVIAFDFMDILFYAIAAYVGFRTAMEPAAKR